MGTVNLRPMRSGLDLESTFTIFKRPSCISWPSITVHFQGRDFRLTTSPGNSLENCWREIGWA